MPRGLIVQPATRTVAAELNDQIRLGWREMHAAREAGDEAGAKAMRAQLRTLVDIRHWARFQTIHEQETVAGMADQNRRDWKVVVGASG